MHAPPGSRVEVGLLQYESIGETRIQRKRLGVMRMSVNDVLGASITEIRLGQRVLDELLMTQASWQPPYMYVNVLGGFGVMNAAKVTPTRP